jgi:hypothetical protein
VPTPTILVVGRVGFATLSPPYGPRSYPISDCLHCDINELVRERIEGQENVDLGDMVARISESLAETIMLGPKDQWAALTAEAIRHLGQTMLEDIEGIESSTAH